MAKRKKQYVEHPIIETTKEVIPAIDSVIEEPETEIKEEVIANPIEDTTYSRVMLINGKQAQVINYGDSSLYLIPRQRLVVPKDARLETEEIQGKIKSGWLSIVDIA